MRSFGMAADGIPKSLTTTLSIDLLPRLTQIIQLNLHGVDPVVANWTQGGIYYGHIIYGKIGMVTDFADLSLTGTQ